MKETTKLIIAVTFISALGLFLNFASKPIELRNQVYKTAEVRILLKSDIITNCNYTHEPTSKCVERISKALEE